MRIYTKVGDGGKTFLLGGRKTMKDDPVIEAIGDVDELNAVLGLAAHPAKVLAEVQRRLFDLGADLAAPGGAEARITGGHVRWAEREIDRLEGSLPPLKNFILPGGGPTAAALHLARAVCRRAERRVVLLLKKRKNLLDAQIFLNRLSDLLFLLARDAARRAKKKETPWLPDQS